MYESIFILALIFVFQVAGRGVRETIATNSTRRYFKFAATTPRGLLDDINGAETAIVRATLALDNQFINLLLVSTKKKTPHLEHVAHQSYG